MSARIFGCLVIAIVSIAMANSGRAQSNSPDGAWKVNLDKDQVQQMEIALQRGRTKSLTCVTTIPSAAQGAVTVDVVFDGQKGRIVEATVRPPYAGTASESCIRRSFIGEIVLPFDGPPRRPTVVFGGSAQR